MPSRSRARLSGVAGATGVLTGDDPYQLWSLPNELWSWDITKLRGPTRGVWYALYVVLDVFSRAVVGWRLAQRERGELAEALSRCRRRCRQQSG